MKNKNDEDIEIEPISNYKTENFNTYRNPKRKVLSFIFGFL